MARYEDNFDMPGGRINQQRDLVLAMNEFCFLQNKTNGMIRANVGPMITTISGQEALVTFNSRAKKFEETTNFDVAKQLFTSAPEGWYVILKNPTANGTYPAAGKENNSIELKVGTKVNIPGPISFALYPGQMAKTVRGHKLRSNQYLIARVYDADAANKNADSATIVNADGNEETVVSKKYFVGQLLVIKGTEVSFYIPPTGVEVIPQTAYGDDYIRDAVTLERLEYAILKDEDGEKRYVHGPAVVFPEPTETFVTAPKGGTIFRALELSPISGIYIKVIADYEENGVKHPVGEELFITGNDQMIYYPRPEHAMIQYDGKYMHHAIAIPEGEGRYILNRLTGKVETIKGPQMYLPDPRTEVVVKRKLSPKECELFYPDNYEVVAYNEGLNEKAMEKLARKGGSRAITDAINAAYSTANQEATLAIFETGSNISRGVSYTKPRTITLDTKFDGVVGIDVWTGYAVNVISKTGKREVVVGPGSRLLDYDETLEAMELSTGSPKTSDRVFSTAFLRVENNRVSDIISAQTKDFVEVQIKVSYCVDFLPEHKEKWFSVENYVQHLCDRQRSLIKREVKKYNIEDFYANATDIVRDICLDKHVCTCENSEEACDCDKPQHKGRFFPENGMLVSDTEVLSVSVEKSVAMILEQHQGTMIAKGLELSDAEKAMKVEKQLAAYEKEKIELAHKNELHKMELEKVRQLEKIATEAKLAAEERAAEEAKVQAKSDMQKVLDAIHKAELDRNKLTDAAAIETEQKLAEVEKAKQEAYAATVKSIMESISDDLVAAMTSKSNNEMLVAVSEAMAPWAIANDESVPNTVNKILRGTPMEGLLEKAMTFGKIED